MSWIYLHRAAFLRESEECTKDEGNRLERKHGCKK